MAGAVCLALLMMTPAAPIDPDHPGPPEAVLRFRRPSGWWPPLLKPAEQRLVRGPTGERVVRVDKVHPGVLKAVLANPKVARLACVRRQRDPAAWLNEQLQADYDAAATAETAWRMRVSLADKMLDRREAAAIINAVVEEYYRQTVAERPAYVARYKKLLDCTRADNDDWRRRLRVAEARLAKAEANGRADEIEVYRGNLREARRWLRAGEENAQYVKKLLETVESKEKPFVIERRAHS